MHTTAVIKKNMGATNLKLLWKLALTNITKKMLNTDNDSASVL
jgi:hypothetical protein